jgi:cell division protein FtsA
MAILKKKYDDATSDFFAALDIGSSKVYCAIAKTLATNTRENESPYPDMKVLGFGQHLSRGLKNGNIVDLEQLEDSIFNAIHTAEQNANKNISSVYVNLSGSVLHSETVITEISLSGRQVDDSHIKKLLNLARDTCTQKGYVVHVIPLNYKLDAIGDIKDPRGMTGERLICKSYIVTAPAMLVKNIISCIGRCQLDVAGFAASPYASGLSTLVPDELSLGATLIDFGGGCTTFASFSDGNMVDMASLPVGGNNITNDIARVLSTPLSQAERLKNLYGSLMPTSQDDSESIIIPQLGETFNAQSHQISKNMLTNIIRSRVEEILELLKNRMDTSSADPLVFQRLVITGGGSQLTGFRELAAQILGAQIRVATPRHVVGSGEMISTPMFSTCAGLLLYGFQNESGNPAQDFTQSGGGIWRRVSGWVRENF